MSQIINELATIEVSNEVLQQLDLAGIYKSFSKNYQKLDDLKNFRTEYEKKNRLMRWWHNDKLRDAQLDSAEVQAEFSKTIGQLMMISIMQSKKLSEQQTQLNDQQGKLKVQADGIAEHAGTLQEQHQVLAEQSQKLEALVREYFELKGLTEEGAQKLINIAIEVKATKDQMLQEFIARANDVSVMCAEAQSRTERIATLMYERISRSEEQTTAAMAGIQHDAREAMASYETSLRKHQDVVQNTLNKGLETLAHSQRESETILQSKHAILESSLSDFYEELSQQHIAHQQKIETIDITLEELSTKSNTLSAAVKGGQDNLTYYIEQLHIQKNAMAQFKQEIAGNIKRFRYITIGLSIAVLVLGGSVIHLMGRI